MSNSLESDTLPAYKNPPVIETVLGVQFDRLSTLRNAHLGAFWTTLDPTAWPRAIDAPLLPDQREGFEPPPEWARLVQLQLSRDPSCRVQLTTDLGDRMVQIQNTRLHFNWLKKPAGIYPRYLPVKKEFLAIFSQFLEFTKEHKLGVIRPNQWEVTYVNEIPEGTVWQTMSDWGFFEPLNGFPSVEGVVRAESFSGEWHYEIPEKKGRLHIEWQQSGSKNDSTEPARDRLIRLTLTARGPIDGDTKGLEVGLDLGHVTIVKSFFALMSDHANEYWGLTK